MIEPINDIEFIKKVILSDYVFDQIAQDGMTKELVGDEIITNRAWFLFLNDKGERVGIIGVEAVNNCTIGIHPCVLEGYKKTGQGRIMMKEFFKYFLEKTPVSVIKVNCKIAKCFFDTYRFAKKTGFVDEGIDRLSFVKFGSVWDQNYLGMTRDEIFAKYGME